MYWIDYILWILMAIAVGFIFLFMLHPQLHQWKMLKRKALLLFAPLLISQILIIVFIDMADFLILSEHSATSWTNTMRLVAVSAVVLLIISDIVFLIFLFKYGEKEALLMKMQETENFWNLEKVYLTECEVKQDEVAKIRHDLNNHITAAFHLLENGNAEDAQAILEEVRENIKKTQEFEFSIDPVINVVLQEKSLICEKNGIELRTKINLISRINMKPIEVSAIFSNLLDNAIKGNSTSDSREKYIDLRVNQNGDYIYIKVSNPSVEPIEVKRDRKRYGQEIMKMIAQQYDGEYRWKWKNDGTYQASIVLLIPESEQVQKKI